MFEIKGKYNTAKVFTDNCDETTVAQVLELCNQEFTEYATIRIMPDCHAGAGCVIGTTMTYTEQIVPNLVGVDIGCGMHVIELVVDNVDLKKLDEVIRKYVPAGFDVHDSLQNTSTVKLEDIIAPIDINRAKKSVGTLGGGNHFIELNKDDEGGYYLVIHSGSRNMGKQIAEYWQKVAMSFHPEKKALAWLEGVDKNEYLHDMYIAQSFASLNRISMGMVIAEKMGWFTHSGFMFETVHNYIDIASNILRKGAVSATKGEKLIIPINMRDGSIIAIGKGNEDWNHSAPHGAGRLMGRGEAKRKLSMEDYTKTMEGIYSTSVNQSTLDEAPMAYKGMAEIIDNTKDIIEVKKIIKPVYNFKSSGD
jgi:tRNA-splicing ligase RtcB